MGISGVTALEEKMANPEVPQRKSECHLITSNIFD
jgi:hypothetical protein